jgi:anti-sigma-K factor RskA
VRLAEQARELRALASRLPALADAAMPSDALRKRVMDAVAASPRRPARTPIAMPRSRVQWRPSWNSLRPLALAAAVVIALGGLFAWNVSLRGDGDSDLARLASRATLATPLQAHDAQGTGTVLYFEDDEKAVVLGSGMPRPAAGKTYQLWAIDGGRAVSLGVAEPDDDGRMSAVVSYDAAAATSIAITIEPAGGSEQPTTDPVYTAEV